jgi:hypothetical protein
VGCPAAARPGACEFCTSAFRGCWGVRQAESNARLRGVVMTGLSYLPKGRVIGLRFNPASRPDARRGRVGIYNKVGWNIDCCLPASEARHGVLMRVALQLRGQALASFALVPSAGAGVGVKLSPTRAYAALFKTGLATSQMG